MMDVCKEKIRVGNVLLDEDETSLRFIALQEDSDLTRIEHIPTKCTDLVSYTVLEDDMDKVNKKMLTKGSENAADNTQEQDNHPEKMDTLEDAFTAQVIDNQRPSTSAAAREGLDLEISQPKSQTKISCVNVAMGCLKTFKNLIDRNKHIPKCIFSLLSHCKEGNCAQRDEPFETFESLVKHAVKHHGCKKNEGDGSNTISFEVELDLELFKPKKGDFGSSILALYEHEFEGKKFKLGFLAIVEHGKDFFYIVAVMFGKSENICHYFRVTFSVFDEKGNAISRAGPYPHPSLYLKKGKKSICQAFGDSKSIIDAMKDNALVMFKKDNVLYQKNEHETKITLGLSFTAFAYRCIQMMNHDDVLFSHHRYLMTFDEMEIPVAAHKILKKGKSVDGCGISLAVAGILLPYIRASKNLIIQSSEFDEIMRTLVAMTSGCIENSGATPYEVSCLILFSEGFMVKALEKSIKEITEAVGLTCAVVESSEENTIDSLNVNGSHVVISTPLVFREILRKNKEKLSQVLLKKIQLVIIPNADFMLKDSNATLVEKCIRSITNRTSSNYLCITMSPLVSDELHYCLKKHIYFGEFDAIRLGLGTKQSDQVSPFPILRLTTEVAGVRKIEEVIKVMRTYDQKKRWLILANEDDDPCYSHDYDLLEEVLKTQFVERRKSILRRDIRTHSEPDFFRSFEKDARSVLLTSFYCLHYDTLTKCEGIILFRLPVNDVDFLRLVPLLKNLVTPVFSLRDPNSPNSINFKEF